MKNTNSPTQAKPETTEWQFLTEKQAAELLGVKPRTLRLWRIDRALPHYKITNRVIRYRRSELEAWIGEKPIVIQKPE